MTETVNPDLDTELTQYDGSGNIEDTIMAGSLTTLYGYMSFTSL